MSVNDFAKEADALEQAGETAEALERWRAAVAADPQPANMARLGRLCLRQGFIAEGESFLRAAIEKAPAYSDSYFYLGVYHKEHGNIDEARKLLEASVALDEWAPALIALGHVYRRLKMREAALDCFRRATATDPEESEGWFGLGVTQSFVDDAEAIRSFSKAVSLDASHAAAFRELGHMMWREGDLTAARGHVERALQLDADDPWTHHYLGSLLLLEGRDGEAEAEFRQAIRLWPDQALFHADLGDALLRLGRMEEAERAYKHALGLDTANAIANRRLGIFYQQKRHYEKAKMYLRRALQSDPSDHRSKEALESIEGRSEEGQGR